VPNLPRLSAAVVAKDNGLGVASLLDLAGTKASLVQVRAEAKDYIDIDALITAAKVDLPLALSAAQRLYGPTFNPQITLKALSFFDDGDLTRLPEDIKLRLATAARFEPPERALANPIRFMAYAMTYARHEDMRVIREYVSD
jgi:Nucleotidyl transferase AbiEii toxin, Type IV TA system